MTNKTVEECYREWNSINHKHNQIHNKKTLNNYCLQWFKNYFNYNKVDYPLYIKEYIAIQKIIMNYD